jgi:hypothetical protein
MGKIFPPDKSTDVAREPRNPGNEVKKSTFIGRLFGYTDKYYQDKGDSEQADAEKKRLDQLDTKRWLDSMKRKESGKEAAKAEAQANRSKSKVEQRLDAIKQEKKDAKNSHEENVRIINFAIESYTHLPELKKFVKPTPGHHTHNMVDELYHDPGVVDPKKYKQKSEALTKQAGYRDDNIPNPWWERPGIRTRRHENEITWEEVKKLNQYDTYVPNHYHNFQGADKIYAFPPESPEKLKARRKKQALEQESRYQWNDEQQNYIRNGFQENEGKELSLTFKDNNRRDDAFTSPTKDGLRKAIYRWRTDKPSYPESSLMPSAEDLRAMEAKKSSAKARKNLPSFEFKRNKLDMSRMRVRRVVIEGAEEGDESLAGGESVLGSVVTSIVDMKMSRYEDRSLKTTGDNATAADGASVISDLDSTAPAAQLLHGGKPIIVHDMNAPIMTMKELTTLGLGGKAGPYHPRGNEGFQDATKVQQANAGFKSEIDNTFDTNRAGLVDEANQRNVVLDAVEVYRKAGDHYVLENKSAMSRRSDFEEDSLSLGRQKVRVKLKRHRGALGLDKFKMSSRKGNKLNLESISTKRERAVDRSTEKQLQAKIKGVNDMVEEIKAQQDALAYERQREANRNGGA